jgi:xanthosine utilization system XapX-like protein
MIETSSAPAAVHHQGLIGNYTEGHLLATAKSIVTKKSKNSAIFNTKAENAIPKFNFHGKCLHLI